VAPSYQLLLAGCLLLPGCGSAPARSSSPPPPPKAAGLPRYRDVAGAAGLRFSWGHQGRTPLTNLDTFGCGCAFLDVNGDGRPDILLVGEPACGLFLNRGDGTFEDITARSGLAQVRGPWKGCAVGDADGDGYLDLLLTGYNALRFLRGGPGEKFLDATAASGLSAQGWGSSAGFMDLEGDGRLDLVIGHYVIFNEHTPQFCEIVRGVKSGCSPQVYEPQFARLYRNDGHAHFTDISAPAAMDTTHGKALAVGFCDFDGDGKTDFYLANDGTAGDMMQNLGGGRFRNVGLETGTAFGERAQAQAGMGVDWGDYDRDGRFDFAVSAFSGEPYSLYHNLGNTFEHAGARMGISQPTLKPLGFGTKWTDADNDGWLDLVFANGHVYDNVGLIEPGSTYAQPMMLFHNEAGRPFRDIAAEAGPDLQRPIVGRGLAVGDFDNDGREDLLVVDYEGHPLLLHNETEGLNHWLTLRLCGRPPNSFAYGAVVEARAGTTRWIAQVSPASSYLSSSDPRVHIGLGAVTRLDSLTVRWPDGARQQVSPPEVDRIIDIRQP
jgi:hypothetical protein